MLSWRTARRTPSLSVAVVLVLAVLMPSTAHAAGTEVTTGDPGRAAESPKAPKVAEHTIPTRSVPQAAKPHVDPEPGEPKKAAASHVVADLTDTRVHAFSMFGVTWKSGLPAADTMVEARWRTDGAWSKWIELDVDLAPGEGGRPGTEPQWVGTADAADVRVLSTREARPADLSLTTIDADPATDAANSSAAAPTTTNDVVTAATVSKPAIILRSAWGASSAGSCDSPRYGSTTRGAVMHHTAGSNTYTKAESAGIVRATQAYHMKGRDWCDIGYNFLVDKYGQIFEGRAGGIDKPVRAAHSGNDAVNQETMGVSMMGTYSTTEPSDAMKTAVVNLVSWRFAQYKLPAKGTYSLGGKTLNRIAGHRNVVSTECPGAKAYAWLSASGGLRDRVAGKLAGGTESAVTAEIGGRGASNITATGFDLTWSAYPGATRYQIHLSTSSTRPTTCGASCTTISAPSTGTPKLEVRDLVAGKTYYAWIRGISSAGKALTVWQTAPKTVKLPSSTAGDTVTVPSSRTIAVTGHGYGHGIGMSQYGAQGAARQGVKYDKIVSHYYPGTALGRKAGSIRVLISQDTSDSVIVAGRSGLVFRDVAAKKTVALPASVNGKPITRWQIVQLGSNKTRSTLQYRTSGGYLTFRKMVWVGDAQFEGPSTASTIALIMPDGSTASYRGAIRSALPYAGSWSRDTVNVVSIESYVRGVIAAEMPSSWLPEALKAQAVAARTYGVQSMTASRYYDICSTTSCQVYGGAGRETSATNAATSATLGRILTYDGKPAFTQFSSSSGGYTAAGSQPYLKAVSDSWDNWSGNANHTWTASVSASKIEKAYPAVGTIKQLKVTARNGHGDWGGRVTSLSLVGSAKTVTISGDAARSALGLKSSWFRF